MPNIQKKPIKHFYLSDTLKPNDNKPNIFKFGWIFKLRVASYTRILSATFATDGLLVLNVSSNIPNIGKKPTNIFIYTSKPNDNKPNIFKFDRICKLRVASYTHILLAIFATESLLVLNVSSNKPNIWKKPIKHFYLSNTSKLNNNKPNIFKFDRICKLRVASYTHILLAIFATESLLVLNVSSNKPNIWKKPIKHFYLSNTSKPNNNKLNIFKFDRICKLWVASYTQILLATFATDGLLVLIYFVFIYFFLLICIPPKGDEMRRPSQSKKLFK